MRMFWIVVRNSTQEKMIPSDTVRTDLRFVLLVLTPQHLSIQKRVSTHQYNARLIIYSNLKPLKSSSAPIDDLLSELAQHLFHCILLYPSSFMPRTLI